MKKILNQPKTLMSKKKADALVFELNSDPYDDWTYKAIHCPKGTGYSFVIAYDADGEEVEAL